MRPKKQKKYNKPQYRINEAIREKEIVLIDEEGKNYGVVSIDFALSKAEEAGLDLVEVAPNAKPPVCRILDYGKFLYEQEKKKHEAKKRQKKLQVKEIKLRPRIGEHDLNFKVKHIKNFLEEGDKVKVSVFLRGRERAKPELGFNVLEKVVSMVEDIGEIEKPPKREGYSIIMVLMPKKGGKKSAKN